MSFLQCRSQKRRAMVCAFTLVEMLVVISVIGLLAAMLLPAVSRAQGRARTANCMNNLRQWGMALRANAVDAQNQIPRDGTDAGGSFAAYTSASTGPGSPNDPFAWFNVLPPLVGDRSLSNYYAMTGAVRDKMPFPGNSAGSKIWHCPSARMGGGDKFLNSGSYGFFSYAMNIDLKLKTSIRNGVVGNSYDYPYMPSVGAVPHSSSVVFMTECTFSPTMENYVVTSGDNATGVQPAVRWTYFPKRHNNGGNIVFLDGHAQTYSYDYVFNLTDAQGKEEKWSATNPSINPDIWWNPNRDK
jgi:prepilin-type processing-associated H-X9-DG protein/prepilin-type N-terminal cleavage/methylation domain-containing protein